MNKEQHGTCKNSAESQAITPLCVVAAMYRIGGFPSRRCLLPQLVYFTRIPSRLYAAAQPF